MRRRLELSGLEWWAAHPGGAQWLEALPDIVAQCARRWSLDLREPFAPASIAHVMRVTLADGTPAVLKVSFPDSESAYEGAALRLWEGAGAVRVLAEAPEHRALLLERIEPGTPLIEVAGDDEAGDVVAGLLRRTWRSPPTGHAFTSLVDAAAGWRRAIPAAWEAAGRPFERDLVDRATGWLAELGPSQDPPVVLHQDLHAGNVLRATREPWLIIDPKPLVGEPAFDLAALLRDRREDLRRDPHPERRVRRRRDRLTEALGVDRERTRGWALAHTLAGGGAGQVWFADHVECARWLDAA